ncbi:hypothetical protein COU16_01370 [Candidatus Kaiserbacteria bacterium CG10_big_fil_rev_8_21_14_0_10_47_16]|uniref:Uncharacterized protein n=1 Tax=Candidatus Kaiserbacteria bacterium CG10_big_fil_rev_8_21_14_0_10_47_16 TaxID=1974608 RepID=A0A2H0UE55_9BACT|nr:MAG: hypothetical protein COU16_01370 [Candidatus Kaiserbacteria bacterium CG10_big_fil_rev_8_21_14_0_10_47_16]
MSAERIQQTSKPTRKVPADDIFRSAKHQAAHGEYAFALRLFRRYREALLHEKNLNENLLLVAYRELIDEISFHAEAFILPSVKTVRAERLPNCDEMGLARERVLEQSWYKQYKGAKVLMAEIAFGNIPITDATLLNLQNHFEPKKKRSW